MFRQDMGDRKINGAQRRERDWDTYLGIIKIQVLFVAMRLVEITEAERVTK